MIFQQTTSFYINEDLKRGLREIRVAKICAKFTKIAVCWCCYWGKSRAEVAGCGNSNVKLIRLNYFFQDDGPMVTVLWLKTVAASMWWGRYAAPLRKVCALWPQYYISPVIRLKYDCAHCPVKQVGVVCCVQNVAGCSWIASTTSRWWATFVEGRVVFVCCSGPWRSGYTDYSQSLWALHVASKLVRQVRRQIQAQRQSLLHSLYTHARCVFTLLSHNLRTHVTHASFFCVDQVQAFLFVALTCLLLCL